MTGSVDSPQAATMYYTLVNTDTFNVVGEFDAQDDALAYVRVLLADRSVDLVEPLALERVVEQQETEVVAVGRELLALAHRMRGTSRPSAAA